MLGTTNIGSKLNLAGNILATPVTENPQPAKSPTLGNGSPRSFNMARHLLGSRDESRGPALHSLVDIPDIIEEESTVTSTHEKHVPLPAKWSGNSSPRSSRNEQILFSVTKISESKNPSLKSTTQKHLLRS
eukprot:TRINITY_DN8535_c0_g1_i1.p1 TRINITY_DN8535_c0_g1~~TRINITY_DN8535_c0_g1_i1.p1  ORF type:complete len:131 (-),score=21.57 TRINITY_DN8535_c0_g1_i1:196-588(-)